mmetsp:Transcript_4156/g.5448  ORF Transcript_4156/g.5448 Transcript_4156/m.5448 type:complete len:114 (+) Transcript_4156:125-466(+)|eukprot:CAMPEP_0198136642 /NCGR_PEP_ID=MMETSP1443-20131203/277_1 /TAXON_ID=186043 /ORGANISM="Entomoneis sp., Strain CCMP2396" /LENGTH=113 /DNA_ID=CAMNT_0043797899 /DNA_START=107 /DNA_END=448 /DNA_ORIENTATION=+
MMKSSVFASIFALFFCSSAAAFMAPMPSTVIKSSSLDMTVLAYGSKKKDFKAGSPLSTAVKQLGVPVKYSCKKGDCATCQITLAGRYTKPCVAKVPEEPRLKSLKEKGLEIKV